MFYFQSVFSFFVKSLSNARWTKKALRACFIDYLRSCIIVFRTEKRVITLCDKAPIVTHSCSARCTVDIALNASQCSERDLFVVGFVDSSPFNFATYVLATSNSTSTFVQTTKSKIRLHRLYIQKVAIFRLKSRESSK